MKAIFETGGKQYYVSVGDTIFVEKLDAEVGSDVTFDKVLFADGKAGNPYVDVKVVCTVEKHGKNKKIKISISKFRSDNNTDLRKNIVRLKDIDNHTLS